MAIRFSNLIRMGRGYRSVTDTEGIGEFHISSDKKRKFTVKGNKKRKTAHKKTGEESVIPKTFTAYIQVVYSLTENGFKLKIAREKAPVIRPCEKLIFQCIHSTTGKSSGFLMSEAKKIGEEERRRIIAQYNKF